MNDSLINNSRSEFNHKTSTVGGFIDNGIMDGQSANFIVSKWNDVNPDKKTTIGRVNAQVRHLNASHCMNITKIKEGKDFLYTFPVDDTNENEVE